MITETMDLEKTTLEFNKESVKYKNASIIPSGENLYNRMVIFPKLRRNKISSWESLRDILMNYLRGYKGVKVGLRLTHKGNGYYDFEIWDVGNDGTFDKNLNSQVIYVVDDEDRNTSESGMVGIHGIGLDQFFANYSTKIGLEQGGGMFFMCHRRGTMDDKVYFVDGFNPYITGTSKALEDTTLGYVDSVSDINIQFPSDIAPSENFFYFKIPNVNGMDLLGVESKRPEREIIADLISTTFVKALDSKTISFHILENDSDGNEVSRIDINQGARFIDEYGNPTSYQELKQGTLSLSNEHSYTAKFIQSTQLTDDIKQNFKRKNLRIFGHIPELEMKHEDGWRAFVIDYREEAGCILGEFGNRNSNGVPYTYTIIETTVKNVLTTTEKGTISFPGSRTIPGHALLTTDASSKVLGQDNKWYYKREKSITGDVVDFAKQMNPSNQVQETTRRDTLWNILQNKIPYTDETSKLPAIHHLILNEIYKVYGIKSTELNKCTILKEVDLFNGRVKLDLAGIFFDDNFHIANEWKKVESQVKFNQLVAEISGWERKYKKFPDLFIISCNSEAETIPTDIDSNFDDKLIGMKNDLEDAYPEIEFKLMDTRFLELDKIYKNFKKK
jgi:hypothetical protein